MKPFVTPVFGFLLGLAPFALANEPITLVHQGYLLDTGDLPVSSESLALSFRVVDRSVAEAAETESWSASCTAAVRNGHYTVVLGETCGTDLTTGVFPPGEPRYLEVSVTSRNTVPTSWTLTTLTKSPSRTASRPSARPGRACSRATTG